MLLQVIVPIKICKKLKTEFSTIPQNTLPLSLLIHAVDAHTAWLSSTFWTPQNFTHHTPPANSMKKCTGENTRSESFNNMIVCGTVLYLVP
jgi:hypothetical protein